jgi:hypothetical protein
MGKKDKAAKAGKEEETAAPEAADAVPYATRVKFCSVIARPLADEKLSKKVGGMARWFASFEPSLRLGHSRTTSE